MKMYGNIKWYDSEKKYGYIIGYDKEKYFFRVNTLKDNTIYKSNNLVKFIPNFSKIPFATEVELAE